MSGESLAELTSIDFPLRRVVAMPNGVRVMANGPDLRARGAGPRPVRVVFVGRLSEEKKIDDLLHVWRRIMTVASGAAQLELWGSGSLESELKQMCVNLGIDHSVIFRGYVDSVRDRLMQMDIFVLPSAAEGNSNAVLEAMAAGLPVVSTRVGGTPMLVGSDGARFLVEPGDRDGLYDRLLELIEDEALRRRIGETMRQRVKVHFDIKRVARTYAAAYSLLAAGRRDELDKISNPVITEH
jgi:glycosyltransferase involved in cell wall biosynthesis